MTRMPPQAYTKEVLATAFDWLSRQPENTKKSIRNSDDLVGLFLKATRGKEIVPNTSQGAYASANNASMSDLSSTKNFRNELQDLALNLKQFEDKPTDYLHELNLMMSTQTNSAPNLQSNAQTSTLSQNTSQLNQPHMINQSGITQGQEQNPNYQNQSPINQTSNPSYNAPLSSTTLGPPSKEIIPESADTVLFKLDKKTVTAINLAKERLNLSSNTEAIRVLVSLGEKHLKKIFGTEE